MADRPLSQQYYEDVETLKAKGVSNAEAIRQVAKKHGKKENAVRGGIHQWKARHLDGGGTGRGGHRRATASVDDLIGTARASIEEAIALIGREVEDAKSALDAAQAHYDEVAASVDNRKADLKKKLDALR